MSDGKKFLICLVLGITVVFGGMILMVNTDMEPWMFIAILILGVLVCFLPLFFLRPAQVSVENGVLRIKAPFVDLMLTPDLIQAVEFRESFKPGLRTFGYGGLKKGYGDFTNKELGNYTFAGDTRIPAFVLVRHHGNRLLVFNFADAPRTFAVYNQLKSGTGSDAPVVREGEKMVSSHGLSRKHMFIIAGTIVAIAVIAIVALFAAAHVNASLEGDHLHVDAVMVNENIAYTDITLAEEASGIDYGHRVAGYSSFDYMSGRFRNSDFGNYTLAVHSNVSKCIVVHHHTDRILVFNLGSDAETSAFLTELQARLP